MTTRILTCLSFLLFSLPLLAQFPVPRLDCATALPGEIELVWTNDPETCGPFEATEIWRAPAEDGPYTLVAELTDPTATTFLDPNPAGDLRYYYLRYRYGCDFAPVPTSDTLETLIPRTPVINFVSLEDGTLFIDWEDSPSPEVVGYIVLEVFPNNFVALDTVRTGTRYAVPANGADPTERRFRLVATDACGTLSPQSGILSAAGLSASGGEACTNRITLTPDAATLMTFRALTQLELFAAVDGGSFQSAGTFAPNATTINFDDANDGEDVCFYLEAELQDNRGRARSAVVCRTVSINQPVRDFPLYGVEVDAAGNLVFQYEDDPLQPVPVSNELLIDRGDGVRERGVLPESIFGTGGTLATAAELAAGETALLRVADDCGREVTTNAVAPVVLSVRSFGGIDNQLDWTPLVNNLDGTTTYTVLLRRPGQADETLVTGLTDTRFTHTPPAGGGANCYVIVANYRPAVSQPTVGFNFSSNEACARPSARVYVPNAFRPDAQETANRTFRPFFAFPPEAAGYELLVFDRWGGLLFSTNNPDEGWDGNSDGQALRSGTYLYVLRFTDGDNGERQRSGTVNLLR